MNRQKTVKMTKEDMLKVVVKLCRYVIYIYSIF